jgi:transcription initiation factor TFIIB
MKSIGNMIVLLGLTDGVRDVSNLLFQKLVQTSSIKGRSHKAIVSAIIYIACRAKGLPRSLREITTIYQCKRKEVTKCFSLIKKTIPEIESSIKSPIYYAKRYCSHLGINDPQLSKNATDLAEKAVELEIMTGKSPSTISSAAIYIACQLYGQPKSYREISEVSKMADNTIKKCCKEMF